MPDIKEILTHLRDSRARVRYLLETIEKTEEQKKKINAAGGLLVADSVTLGKKGKKPLGTVTIRGISAGSLHRMNKSLENRKRNLEKEECKLLELTNEAEECISGIENIEIRNILCLYYIDDLNWVQVAHRMNELYGSRSRRYTESSCRQKHDRFLEKI